MLKEDILKLYQRELLVLENELMRYQNESIIWEIAPGITNSAGNLTFHLCGNIRHFIGQVLGGSTYVRQRDLEFSGKPVSLKLLLKLIESTAEEMKHGFVQIDNLEDKYPVLFLNEEHTIGYMLTHLFGHLQYHIGQINYHRRLVQKNG